MSPFFSDALVRRLPRWTRQSGLQHLDVQEAEILYSRKAPQKCGTCEEAICRSDPCRLRCLSAHAVKPGPTVLWHPLQVRRVAQKSLGGASKPCAIPIPPTEKRAAWYPPPVGLYAFDCIRVSECIPCCEEFRGSSVGFRVENQHRRRTSRGFGWTEGTEGAWGLLEPFQRAANAPDRRQPSNRGTKKQCTIPRPGTFHTRPCSPRAGPSRCRHPSVTVSRTPGHRTG